MTDIDTVTMDRIVLEKVTAGVTHFMDATAIQHLGVERACHLLADLVVRSYADFLAREVHRRRDHVEVPADWWQHLRQRWCPRWWLRRRPVRTRRVQTELVVQRVCPHHMPRQHQDWMQVHIPWLRLGPEPSDLRWTEEEER